MLFPIKKTVLGHLNDGGSLRYFFLHGEVAIHKKTGEPDPEVKSALSMFLELKLADLIEVTDREVSGYPYYANNHKSSVYKITEEGKKAFAG